MNDFIKNIYMSSLDSTLESPMVRHIFDYSIINKDYRALSKLFKTQVLTTEILSIIKSSKNDKLLATFINSVDFNEYKDQILDIFEKRGDKLYKLLLSERENLSKDIISYLTTNIQKPEHLLSLIESQSLKRSSKRKAVEKFFDLMIEKYSEYEYVEDRVKIMLDINYDFFIEVGHKFDYSIEKEFISYLNKSKNDSLIPFCLIKGHLSDQVYDLFIKKFDLRYKSLANTPDEIYMLESLMNVSEIYGMNLELYSRLKLFSNYLVKKNKKSLEKDKRELLSKAQLFFKNFLVKDFDKFYQDLITEIKSVKNDSQLQNCLKLIDSFTDNFDSLNKVLIKDLYLRLLKIDGLSFESYRDILHNLSSSKIEDLISEIPNPITGGYAIAYSDTLDPVGMISSYEDKVLAIKSYMEAVIDEGWYINPSIFQNFNSEMKEILLELPASKLFGDNIGEEGLTFINTIINDNLKKKSDFEVFERLYLDFSGTFGDLLRTSRNI